jgi:hypothetical protein
VLNLFLQYNEYNETVDTQLIKLFIGIADHIDNRIHSAAGGTVSGIVTEYGVESRPKQPLSKLQLAVIENGRFSCSEMKT